LAHCLEEQKFTIKPYDIIHETAWQQHRLHFLAATVAANGNYTTFIQVKVAMLLVLMITATLLKHHCVALIPLAHRK
jgi:hypothetical protein